MNSLSESITLFVILCFVDLQLCCFMQSKACSMTYSFLKKLPCVILIKPVEVVKVQARIVFIQNKQIRLMWTATLMYFSMLFFYSRCFPYSAGVTDMTVALIFAGTCTWIPCHFYHCCALWYLTVALHSPGHARGSIYPLWYVCKHFYSFIYFIDVYLFFFL